MKDFNFNFNGLAIGYGHFRTFGLALSGALVFFSASCQAKNDYKIAVNEAYSFAQGAVRIQTLFDKVYAPLGITPLIEFYPSLRGLKLVDEGKLDAEAGRTADIGGQYANLIKVSTPFVTHHNGYFCLQARFCKVTKHSSLALVAGFETGKRFCSDNHLDCLFDQSPGVIVNAFESGAIEALIGSFNTATKILCKLKNKQVYYKGVDALTITSYHFIHKKHQDIEPALALSIRELVDSGEVDRLLQDTTLLDKTCLLDLIQLD